MGEWEQLAGGPHCLSATCRSNIKSRPHLPGSQLLCRVLQNAGQQRVQAGVLALRVWWQQAGTAWPCSCLEFPRYKYVAKASRGCGACCICSACMWWTKGCISPICSWNTGKVYKFLEFHWWKASESKMTRLKKCRGRSASIASLPEMRNWTDFPLSTLELLLFSLLPVTFPPHFFV